MAAMLSPADAALLSISGLVAAVDSLLDMGGLRGKKGRCWLGSRVEEDRPNATCICEWAEPGGEG